MPYIKKNNIKKDLIKTQIKSAKSQIKNTVSEILNLNIYWYTLLVNEYLKAQMPNG